MVGALPELSQQLGAMKKRLRCSAKEINTMHNFQSQESLTQNLTIFEFKHL